MHVVRQHRYGPPLERDQMPDTLILITPGQQLAGGHAHSAGDA
jgi:hypothetical protein